MCGPSPAHPGRGFNVLVCAPVAPGARHLPHNKAQFPATCLLLLPSSLERCLTSLPACRERTAPSSPPGLVQLSCRDAQGLGCSPPSVFSPRTHHPVLAVTFQDLAGYHAVFQRQSHHDQKRKWQDPTPSPN